MQSLFTHAQYFGLTVSRAYHSFDQFTRIYLKNESPGNPISTTHKSYKFSALAVLNPTTNNEQFALDQKRSELIKNRLTQREVCIFATDNALAIINVTAGWGDFVRKTRSAALPLTDLASQPVALNNLLAHSVRAFPNRLRH